MFLVIYATDCMHLSSVRKLIDSMPVFPCELIHAVVPLMKIYKNLEEVYLLLLKATMHSYTGLIVEKRSFFHPLIKRKCNYIYLQHKVIGGFVTE